MKFAVKTDIGQRAHNEDNYLLPEHEGFPLLFAVADGMGGHAAGAVASSLLVEKLKGFDQELEPGRELETLRLKVERANLEIFRESEKTRAHRGMGTTLVAALVLGSKYIALNIGDSRMYRFDGGIVRAVTADHSLVEQLVRAGAISPEEARYHPQRNVITRAVGLSPAVDADIFELDWKPGDILVLCSDGLHGVIEDDDFVSVLSSGRSLESMCDVLVQLALDAGGTDNITVILIRLEEGDVV